MVPVERKLLRERTAPNGSMPLIIDISGGERKTSPQLGTLLAKLLCHCVKSCD
jgi:hypothetical protein